MEKHSLLDSIGMERAATLMGEAVRKAIAEAHAHGLPVTVDVNGEICRIYPDGRIEPIGTASADTALKNCK